MAVVYRVQGNFPLAIDYYNKALVYDRKTKDTLGMAIVLNDLGEVYHSIKKPSKALKLHEQSLNYSLKNGNKRLVAVNNGNLGNIYLVKKEYLKALDYYRNSLKASQETNDLKQMAICFNNIGAVHLLLEHPKTARDHLFKAKEIAETTNLKHIKATSLLGIAETYVFEKKYHEALVFVNEGKKIAEELELLENKKKAAALLTIIYENTQRYKKALESHQQFKALNDSLFNKENIEEITQIEYEYKYKQALDSASLRELKLTKTVLTTSQDLARTRQNYLWAIIGILVISIVSGSTVFYQKFNTIKAKNQNIITEQKLLRSQMTPHFIFNSLSVLQGMILNKEAKKSVTYLSKFSKLLRIVLENSRDKIVPLIQELDAIDNYMILQNLDAVPPYDYSLTVAENIDINLFLVPPMLIQPFIENAIEHAFKSNQENREIAVHISFNHNELSCTIIDNGIGIDAISTKTNGNKKSLATTITGERLRLLAKDFNMPADIVIVDRKKDNERGTRVTLVIPYRLRDNA
jgi:tetratricopeptide (TPR) repeat protein